MSGTDHYRSLINAKFVLEFLKCVVWGHTADFSEVHTASIFRFDNPRTQIAIMINLSESLKLEFTAVNLMTQDVCILPE
jgi:hypothetical protein